MTREEPQFCQQDKCLLNSNSQLMIHRQPFRLVEILQRLVTKKDHSEIRMAATISNSSIERMINKMIINTRSIRAMEMNSCKITTIKAMAMMESTMMRISMDMRRNSLMPLFNHKSNMRRSHLQHLEDSKLIENFTKD